MKRFLIAVSMLVIAALQLRAAPNHPKTQPNIFETFQVLDQQFTRLDTQFHDLQRALQSKGTQTKMRRERKHATKEMRATTMQIRRLSYRLYKRYRADRSLGHRMFVQLNAQARDLQERLLKLSREPSQKLARREEETVAKAMLDLVLQYQAVSGGYAAATCSAGAWSCGVPKKEARTVGYPTLGVKWICVQQRASCSGILGPRAPKLSEPPLTANTQSH